MTTDNKLKPCPFCGGEAMIDDLSASYRPDAEPWWGVGCDNNDCPIEVWATSSDRERAIAAWNTRINEARNEQ